MDFIDFFAGIGGGRRGLEEAGHRCVGFVENDENARMSYLAIHHCKESLNGVSRKEARERVSRSKCEWNERDIRNVREVPRAGIWIFGAPCKSFSVGGKREGLNGESGLVREMFRLLNDTKDKPEWLVYENVKGMFSTTRGFDFLRVLLEMDGAGYDIRWQTLNTKDFGLPQNRERVYVIGHCREYGQREIPVIRGAYEAVDCGIREGIKVVDGTKKGWTIAHEGDSVNFSLGNVKTRRGRVGHQIAQCLTTTNEQAYLESIDPVVLRRLTPLESFRLQGWTDEDFYRASSVNAETELYKQAGNGMSIPVIREIGNGLKG